MRGEALADAAWEFEKRKRGGIIVELVFAFSVFVLMVVMMVSLRSRVGDRFEVKNSDILIALIPIAFWFVLSGKLKVIEFGGIKLETAFVQASQAEIADQVTPVRLPVEAIRMDPKGGVGEIPRLIKKRTEALTFQLAHGGYFGPAIRKYLSELVSLPFFKYVIINRRDGRFFGLLDAREFRWVAETGQVSYREFANWLNTSNEAALQKIPGFVPVEVAVKKREDKTTALKRMEDKKTETLPVIDDEERFKGVVERSRLVSSLILDIAERVK